MLNSSSAYPRVGAAHFVLQDDAAPGVRPLILPAVEGLLAMQPSAEQLARAAYALWVDMAWPPDSGLMARLLAAARPSLMGARCARPGLAWPGGREAGHVGVLRDSPTRGRDSHATDQL